MKNKSFAKSLATVGLAALCVAGITGCAGGGEDQAKETYTGGVAATVNGAEIQEDTVTAAIEGIREQMGVTDTDSWGKWLAENDYTPESVREEIINSYVDQELVKQGCESMGLTANEDEVNQYIESMRGNYDTDEAWAAALESVGLSEEEYRENIELSLISQQLRDKVAENAAEPTDEELLTAAQTYVTSYDGAKKSSHILFDSSDEALAKEVLEKLKSGELDFAVAAESYSKDTGSASDGGNVGWDKLNQFVTEYTEALDGLKKGEISDLVTSTYGIHIIMCTDVFEAPEKLESMDQLPEEFQESIKAMLDSNNQNQAYYTWVEEQREAADIVINDMPEGLPYYVDMANYPKDDSDTSGAITGTDENGNPVTVQQDGTTEGTEGDAAQAEGTGDDAADQGAEGDAAQPAEGADGEGDAAQDDAKDGDAAGDQPAEGDSDGQAQPAAE